MRLVGSEKPDCCDLWFQEETVPGHVVKINPLLLSFLGCYEDCGSGYSIFFVSSTRRNCGTKVMVPEKP
jgi:hypothetical protein